MLRNGKIVLLLLIIITAVSTLSAFALTNNSGDKVAFFSDIYIPRDVTVNGTAFALFGDIKIDGTVRGDTVTLFGDIKANGTVNGSAVAVMGRLDIEEHGVIYGDAVGLGGGVDTAESAIIRGEIADASFNVYTNDFFSLAALIIGVMLLINYGIFWLVMIVMPDRIKLMTNKCFTSLWKNLLIGIISFIMFPVIITALAITIIGIIAIPFFILFYFIIAYISMIPISIAIGKLVVPSLQGKNSQLIHLLVGMLILAILLTIPLLSIAMYPAPSSIALYAAAVGFLFYMLIWAVGLGVLVDTRLGGTLKGRS